MRQQAKAFFLTLLLFCFAKLVYAIEKDFFLHSRAYEFFIVYHYLREACPQWSRGEADAVAHLTDTVTAYQRLKLNLLIEPRRVLLDEITRTGLNLALLQPQTQKYQEYQLTDFIETCDLIMEFCASYELNTIDPKIARPFQILSITDAMTELVMTERAYAARLWCFEQHLASLTEFHPELHGLLHLRIEELNALKTFHTEQSILMEERMYHCLDDFVRLLTQTDGLVFQMYDRFLQSRLDVLVATNKGPHALYLASPFIRDALPELAIAPMQRLCKYPLLTATIAKQLSHDTLSPLLHGMIDTINNRRAASDVHANVVHWKNIDPTLVGTIIKRYTADVCVNTDHQATSWRPRIIHVYEHAIIFYKKKEEYVIASHALPASSMTSEHSIKTITPQADDLILQQTYKIIGQLTFSSIVSTTMTNLHLSVTWIDTTRQHFVVHIRLHPVSVLVELSDLIRSRSQYNTQERNVR